uniref:peptidylprolyl isomerase n=1 Tax=Hanusia phi TaxID=3032 RepID=A0A7S0ETH1_9CRYP
MVSVHYTGTLQSDGSKFDSSRDRPGTFEFQVGVGQVIKGWDQGIVGMKRDELCILRCRSDYAYGSTGSPPKIPGGATLDFEVELFDWWEKDKDIWEMSTQEKVEKAEKCKEDGNAKFKAGQFDSSIVAYEKGLSFVKDIFDEVGGGAPEDAVLAKPVAVALSLNVAQAKLKGNGDLKSAIEDCNFAIKLEASNTKAFFRRAQIHTKKADFQSAKSDLQRLLEIDPKNSDAEAELKRVTVNEAKAVKAEKAMFSKMFS